MGHLLVADAVRAERSRNRGRPCTLRRDWTTQGREPLCAGPEPVPIAPGRNPRRGRRRLPRHHTFEKDGRNRTPQTVACHDRGDVGRHGARSAQSACVAVGRDSGTAERPPARGCQPVVAGPRVAGDGTLERDRHRFFAIRPTASVESSILRRYSARR